MVELEDIMRNYTCDKGDVFSDGAYAHNYVHYYKQYLDSNKNKIKKVLEIGIGKSNNAASLRVWRDYFPNAEIIGLDLYEFNLNIDKVRTYQCDQSSRRELSNIINKVGGDFDLIIDDGGHWIHQQQISLGYLFKYLKPNGIYVIEDMVKDYREVYNYNYSGDDLYNRLVSHKSKRSMLFIPYDLFQLLSYGNFPKNEFGDYIYNIGKYGMYKDLSNSTYKLIEDLNYNKNNVDSIYMSKEEIYYLIKHTDESYVYDTSELNCNNFGYIGFIRKK